MAIPFDVWSPLVRDALGRFAAVQGEIMQEVATYTETRAKGYAPVDKGELRASIRGGTEGVGTGRTVSRPRLFLTAPGKYAPIEFGSWRGHRAQRFLERAMEDGVKRLEERLLKDIPDLLLKGQVGHIGPRFSGRRL